MLGGMVCGAPVCPMFKHVDVSICPAGSDNVDVLLHCNVNAPTPSMGG